MVRDGCRVRRLVRVLDVLHEYAFALEPARALPSRALRPLASRTVEKSRLDSQSQPGEELRGYDPGKDAGPELDFRPTLDVEINAGESGRR